MKTLTRVAFTALAFGLIPYTYSYAQEPVDLAPDTSYEEEAELEQYLDEEILLEEESFSEGEDVLADMNSDEDRVPTLEDAKKALEAMSGAKDAVKGKVPTEVDQDVYDIYGRQLSYREGANEYRESLDKRRENFAKPRTKMIEEYHKTRDVTYAAETADYQKKLNEQKEEELAGDGMQKLPTGEGVEAALEGEVVEEIGIKEQRIPGDMSVRKKVVTADNAPEFDPANLNRKPVQVKNAEPPPMPEVAEKKVEPVVEVPAPAPESKALDVEAPAVEEKVEQEAAPVVEVPAVETEAEPMAEETVDEAALALEPVAETEAEEAVDEISDEAVDEEADALMGEEQMDNPFEDQDVKSPFDDREEQIFND